MRKSNNRDHRYRPGTSRFGGNVVSLRGQMTDYAKGDVLRELRSRTRLSREKVAAELDITPKTLFTWEKQNGAIKWENAKRLAAFYDVEPDSLVTRDQDEAAGLPGRDQLERMEQQLARLEEIALQNQQLLLALATEAGITQQPAAARALREVAEWRERKAAEDQRASQSAPVKRRRATG